MAYAVAVDIGGTFTDLVAYDHAAHTGRLRQEPDHLRQSSSKASSTASTRLTLTPAAASIRQSRHHARHQLADPAQGRQGGAGHHQGLPRRARDRARQPARSVRPALPPRRAADPAPAALRGDRADRQQGRDRHAARRSRADDARRARSEKLAIEAVAIFFMNSYANPAHEETAAESSERALCPTSTSPARTELTREWYEYERTSTVAANAYVGPQVTTYIRRTRERPHRQGLLRLALHDGLERRPALGRAHLPAAGRAGRIRPDRRLHRRRRLCGGARFQERRSPSTWAARPPSARWSRTAASR